MKRRFVDEDLIEWSRFSGDVNPIHFDADAASKAGWQSRGAHGMLAMLPLKQGLESDTLDCDGGAARRWSAALKHPVHLDRDYEAKVETQTSSKRKLRLLDVATGSSCIQGRYEVIEGLRGLPDGTSAPLPIDESRLREKLADFERLAPQNRLLWVFLDCFAFYLFIQSSAFNILGKEFPDYARPSQSPSLDDFAVMQVLHEVEIAPWLVSATLDAGLPEVTYDIRPTESFPGNGSQTGIVRSSVWADSKRALSIEMALVVRPATSEVAG